MSRAGWVLFFLAPAIGELLSGSAPPVKFFNPAGFVALTVMYGAGAILARELTVRWQKGWPTILALGAAFGIVNEGLAAKSFFDPNWVDVGHISSRSLPGSSACSSCWHRSTNHGVPWG